MIKEIRLQNTGIAMCCIELSSKERLTGDREIHDRAPLWDREHIVS
ncbi:MAG: hypothetical protein AABY92_07770 [Thermodesulfobacteriota bacterium]